MNDDGTYYIERKPLPSHVCSKEEMGFVENESEDTFKLGKDNPVRFFKAHPNAKKYPSTYQKKFLCVDKDYLEIYGDFNTAVASQFNIQLIKCKGGKEKGCKDDAEITNFFRNKWIMLYYNQIRFDSFKYGSEAITPEAQMMWLSINTQMQTMFPFKISTTKLMLQD